MARRSSGQGARAEVETRLAKRVEEGPLTLREATELVDGLGGSRPTRILEHLGYAITWRDKPGERGGPQGRATDGGMTAGEWEDYLGYRAQ